MPGLRRQRTSSPSCLWMKSSAPWTLQLVWSTQTQNCTTGKPEVPKYILFIQLELCDKSLKDYKLFPESTDLNSSLHLAHRGSVDELWDIFRQTCEGLCYTVDCSISKTLLADIHSHHNRANWIVSKLSHGCLKKCTSITEDSSIEISSRETFF